jgi:hypothetical protein
MAMLTPELAGVSRRILGACVVNLSNERHTVIAALGLLIAGI